MTIPSETEAQIMRYFHVEKWKVGTIARQLGIHHSTVDRVLSNAGLPKVTRTDRVSILDPYLPFVIETLEQFPKLTASRLYGMVRERGYSGGPDHFRHLMAHHRPRPIPEAYLRLRTLPGEQAQLDWGHFGKIKMGRSERALMAFAVVLSYSRQIFLRFYPDARMSNFLLGHQALPGAPALKWRNHQRLAKKRMRAIIYTRGQDKKARLYRDLIEPNFLSWTGYRVLLWWCRARRNCAEWPCLFCPALSSSYNAAIRRHRSAHEN